MKSALEVIKAILENLAAGEVEMSDVFYGQANFQKLDKWNYFVFNRLARKKSSNKVDYETYYQVHIIHEDYIPEGYIQTVINELTSRREDIKIRTTSEDIVFNYVLKGKTNVVVEIASITLVVPEKRC